MADTPRDRDDDRSSSGVSSETDDLSPAELGALLDEATLAEMRDEGEDEGANEVAAQRAAGAPNRTEDKGVAPVLGVGTVTALFSAAWCPLTPHIEQTVSSHAVNVTIVDVDIWPELATAWRVSTVPTLLHLKDGNEIVRKLGTSVVKYRAR
jgi:hypothetical protein